MTLAKSNPVLTLVALLGFLALFLLAMADLALHPQRWDANVYLNITRRLVEQGFSWGLPQGVKSVGYPTLLFPLALAGAPLPITAVVIQGVLYLLASLWLAAEVGRHNERLGAATLLGLLLNPLNIWILNVTLSEAPTLIVFLTCTASLLRLERSNPRVAILFWVLGTGLAAFAVQLRPANIVVLFAWCVAAVVLLARRSDVVWGQKAAAALLALLVMVTVSYPQLQSRFGDQGRHTTSPYARLASLQLTQGIRMAKFGSSADRARFGALIYKNPFYDGGKLPSKRLLWYVQNPLMGLGTVALHVFNSFSFDYHSVYIYNLTPPLPWAFPFLIWIVAVSGVLTLVVVTRSIPFRAPAIVFVSLVVLGTIALNSIVAVENRFNLLPMSLLMVMAAYGAMKLAALPRRSDGIKYIVAVVLIAGLSTVGTELMKLTAPKIQAKVRVESQPGITPQVPVPQSPKQTPVTPHGGYRW